MLDFVSSCVGSPTDQTSLKILGALMSLPLKDLIL